MRRPLLCLLVLLVFPILIGCGGGGAGAGPGRDPDVIGSWELQEVPDYNALEAIRRLRPAWLRVRSQPSEIAAAGTGSSYPKVHIDGVPLQDISRLETIPAADIREMRYLSGPDASTRWGTGYTNGAILIITEG